MTAMTSCNLSGKHTGGKRPLQVDASGDTHVKIYFEKHFHLPFIKCTRDKKPSKCCLLRSTEESQS